MATAGRRCSTRSATLDAAKLDPTTLVLREPTLDDVFLELTGHVAEQATENGDEAMSTGRTATKEGAQ